ncbi:MAG: hypothetical protein M0Z60_11680 [Nitrospiraceae bacterium]|nr:hypothetical protein [Nitrospiraceae bacterium]
MTKVRINSGVCGFTATVTAEKEDKRKVRITIESDCEMVQQLAAELPALDMMSAFTAHLNNPVYRAANIHIKHIACPVPAGIIKALEVELGLAIPKDAGIIFIKE